MKRIKLVTEITPLQKLNYKAGSTSIYMKRDDQIGFGGGGNKVRLFEYIASDVVEKRADKIITFGSVHSNHIRVAAVVASYLNIPCDLIVLYDERIGIETMTPNLRLIGYCGNVHIEYCETAKAHGFIDEYLEEQKKSAVKYYWIPGGGHMPVSIQGYADAGKEIIGQLSQFGKKADAIFVPCGTGTTQAGLILGLNDSVPVYGVTVARDVGRCKKEISSILKKANYEITDEKLINVLPSSIKYGEKNQDMNKIIAALVKNDGIFLDPVYNAKSFLAMLDYIKSHPKIENIVYVNTGGFPNLLA